MVEQLDNLVEDILDESLDSQVEVDIQAELLDILVELRDNQFEVDIRVEAVDNLAGIVDNQAEIVDNQVEADIQADFDNLAEDKQD